MPITGRPIIDRHAVFVAASVIMVVAWVYLTRATGQESADKSSPPAVEWSSVGEGWVKVDQLGDGMSLAVKRDSIHVIAYHSSDSPYATRVYRDNAELVVFNVLAAEYRVRCPDKETAAELIKFLLGIDDGKG